MQKFQHKPATIEAEQHMSGHNLSVMNEELGEQTAHKGDYLVGTERGKIKVIPKAEFEAEWEPIAELATSHAPEAKPEKPVLHEKPVK